MATILLTGGTGLIGKALAAALVEDHEVVCLCRRRRNPGVQGVYVQGQFDEFEDLRKLDAYRFDAVVHLAAATGGCPERDSMLVNVEGTRCLMRYLIDRGCRKHVLASTTAAVGFQSVLFRPLQVPIPDEHPCLDRDGYGFSKYLMEEVSRYYQRQNPQIDVLNIRLAAVSDDSKLPGLVEVRPIGEWSLGAVTFLALSDTVRLFRLAVEAEYRPGVRIINGVGPKAWVADNVADILRHWYGDEVDLSHYLQPGHEKDSVFDSTRARQELGFTPKILP